MSIVSAIVPVFRGLFIILLTISLVSNPKELFGSYGCFCHLVIMHIMATVAAVWIQMFLWESNKDWQDALHFKHNSSSLWEQNEINISV
ncbi:hypothetical protein X975_09635, partial [Stegodyphus mimosarum]